MTAHQPVSKARDTATWVAINRDVVAKAISELTFEECLAPREASPGRWELTLGSGVTYRFAATRRIWGQLSVRPETLTRDAGVELPVDDAVAFFADSRETLGMSPATFCTYAKELYNTLMADRRIAERRGARSAAELAMLPDPELQTLLDGHPKAPANKGRLGWGLDDFERYAPESGETFQLFWLAAARDRCKLALDRELDEEALLQAALDPDERRRLEATLAAAGLSRRTHLLMPVHPWQWQGMIASQFAGEIAARRLAPLGRFGDPFLPLQSLRTLANTARPEAFHVKLPLTILNTSAWRGVPGKYMEIGADLSRWLGEVAAADPVLKNVKVLREVAGAFYPHPHYSGVDGAPYQFCEMLGAIWRESPEKDLPSGHRPMMMGALPQRDAHGRPIASALIEQSGLDAEVWLDRLFSSVFVPLYHFMCRYGVGFIAHGQNITVILDGATPVGVAVKDFQGDLDLVDQSFPELGALDPKILSTLKRRPPAHLLQHLQTGHIVSVLRFLSEALAEYDSFDERRFYAILATATRRYQAEHPELADRFALFDLFAPEIPRIAINKVRFAIGYGDAGERPLPDLGTPLDNPLNPSQPGDLPSAQPAPNGV
ncbi:IucA/IucC family protein [Mesorhizobium sp. Root554]|uniref:IucA/IucC family protein n=1 Tax=unclassified Mesorhizobium TaxID=325217 RepID=UPI0006F46782|nr:MULTISPECIES: IucA/IucC family siderophore biosynthesis protein [unclassified Mesorhizobium]KQZ15019.1 IucA/IucC family protein [Mesorhizobium sp. Root1471]KQZ37528.1 IucA/IucC family protein [Mesorhizobium sp. Root554]